eukprot:NODE_5313_length_692_cov_4.409020_g4939_i0.p1 GENE.NODE_5313_length_692_cov_4.409020_g4939_i0~~NODE_5313_length_692_cov_4.409020_g4939_i0.p1  ORF type:complete len:217 (-),score=40.40 NODE_5313_length_692_cov_4.409020_g4939_i0:40-690(-)
MNAEYMGTDGQDGPGKPEPEKAGSKKRDPEVERKKDQVKESTRKKQENLQRWLDNRLNETENRWLPLGEDRWKRIYWRLPGSDGVWVQSCRGYSLKTAGSSGMDVDRSAAATATSEPPAEQICVPTGVANIKNFWEFYPVEALGSLVAALDVRGLRESSLRTALLPLVQTPPPPHSPLSGEASSNQSPPPPPPPPKVLDHYTNKFRSAFPRDALDW